MRITFLLLGLFFVIGAEAQEFQAKVNVNAPKLQTVDPKVFKTLESAITEMINNTAWTNDVYETYEQIEVTFNLNINEEVSATSFKADLQIQATRPIFNSDKKTVLFNHSDKQTAFTYEEYQPIEVAKNSFNTNLTSIISYYCYIILGLDYDTFASLGGTDHFQEAQNILNTVPQNIAGAFPGWRSLDGQRNRYWLVENIMSPRMEPMRKAMYDYHLRGLDRLADEFSSGQQAIIGAVNKLGDVNRAYPNSMIMQIFSNSKRTEILQIFIGSESAQKRKVYDVMVKLDAANASQYIPLRR